MKAVRALAWLLVGQETSNAFAWLLAAILWTVATLLAPNVGSMVGGTLMAGAFWVMYFREVKRLERVHALRKYR